MYKCIYTFSRIVDSLQTLWHNAKIWRQLALFKSTNMAINSALKFSISVLFLIRYGMVIYTLDMHMHIYICTYCIFTRSRYISPALFSVMYLYAEYAWYYIYVMLYVRSHATWHCKFSPNCTKISIRLYCNFSNNKLIW